MMNQILKNQNQPEFIQLLKASAVAYTNAKKGEIRITYLLILLAFAYPVSFVIIQDETLKLILFGCSFLITVLIQIFTGIFDGNTAKGAIIKEEFDIQLFNIRWKSTLKHPDYSEVYDLARHYKGKEISDWYSRLLSEDIPDNMAVAVLQHSNTIWDITLRRRFRSWLIGLLSAYTILLFVFMIAANSDGKTIFLVLFALLSVYTHFIKSIRGHHSAIARRRVISIYLDEAITKRKRITMQELRDIQDDIYQTRCEPSKVPDFFFRIYRKSMDATMDEYIERINKIYSKVVA